jgi:hypothetical protein
MATTIVMIRSPLFWFFGLNVGWGIFNLILASKLAEYRLDDLSTDGGMGPDIGSIRRRFTFANYRAQGQRLLRWYVASIVAQVLTLAGWIFLFAE